MTRVYQFVPLAAVAVQRRWIRAMGADTMAVLDLEDGLIDVDNPAATDDRRMRARLGIRALCVDRAESPAVGPVALRMNAVGSDDFERDLPVARAIAETIGLTAVLLPKIASGRDMEQGFGRLRGGGVTHADVIPVIETVGGVERIAEIAAAASAVGSTSVVYGPYDYALDAGWWPFPGPGERLYWEPVMQIVAAVVPAGLRYIHPPIAAMRDETLLGAMIATLRSLCGREFDLFSAGMSQTTILGRLARESRCDPSPLIDPPGMTMAEQRVLAAEVVSIHEDNRRQHHSFAADARRGRFVPPHEYLAALRILREHGDA